jgi:methylthioribulose 1-phosphate dehydratase/enolase-phosphatase E1
VANTLSIEQRNQPHLSICSEGKSDLACKELSDSVPHLYWLQRVILLDIEGTTTPISFVTDVLFPYAREHAVSFLRSTYDTNETQCDIQLLRKQVAEDLEQGLAEAVFIPPDNAGMEAVVSALEKNVQAMIKADRKITSLKQLQGHIWRVGYEQGELHGEFFDDVPEALAAWHASGNKTYIYSSGSREAQRLIFGNTKYGDLRQYLSGFFDTTIGLVSLNFRSNFPLKSNNLFTPVAPVPM